MTTTQNNPSDVATLSHPPIAIDKAKFDTQVIIGQLNVFDVHNAPRGSGGQHHRHHPAPSTSGGTPPQTKPIPPIKPVVTFADDGDKITTYHDDKDGSEVQFREDKQNGGNISVTLKDANGTITTHASRRGYEARHVGADGLVTTEQTKEGGGSLFKYQLRKDLGLIETVPAVMDSVTCGNKSTNALPIVADGVTRDQIQQFFSKHKELSDTMQTVTMPLTVSGGHQVDTKEALALPTHVRACPIDQPGVAVAKK